MLLDWIGTSFCEAAIDEERSYVSGRMDDKSGMATCHPEYFVMALVRRLQERTKQYFPSKAKAPEHDTIVKRGFRIDHEKILCSYVHEACFKRLSF
jgi:hypothetical protein